MKSNGLERYLVKSFAFSTLKTISVGLATLLLLPLILRKIGFETYGLISLVMFLGGTHGIFDLGLAKAATLMIGQSKKKSEINQVFSDIIFITLILGLFIGIILVILSSAGIDIFGESIDAASQNILLFGWIYLLLLLINNVFISTLEAIYLIKWVYISQILSSLSLSIFLLLFSSLPMLLLAPVLSQVLGTAFLFMILVRKSDIVLVVPSLERLKRVIPLVSELFIISIATAIPLPANKYAIIYLTADPRYIGIFEASYRLVNVAKGLLNSMSQPLYGVISNMEAIDNKHVVKITKRVFLAVLTAYLFGNTTFMIIGRDLMSLIGSNSEDFYRVTKLLLIFISFGAVAEPFYRSLMGISELRTLTRLRWIPVVLNIIFYLIFTEENVFYKIVMSFGCAIISSSLISIVVGWNTLKGR